MLASHLAQVGIVDEVALDNNARAAIAIVAVGSNLVVVDGIGGGADVVNGVSEDPSVPRLIISGIGRDALESNIIQPDIVAIVHQIVGFHKVLNVAIE